jgi:hypothetical protein
MNQQWQVDAAPHHHVMLARGATPGARTCLDVYGAAMEDGAPVFQWECSASARHQRFYALRQPGTNDYMFRAYHSGKCVGFAEAGDVNGTPLVQQPCTGAPEQRFVRRVTTLAHERIDGFDVRPERLQARHLPKCLDRDGVSTSMNGAPIQLWACSTSKANQAFVFPRSL